MTPTSAIGSPRRAKAGFTLVEIMVVVMIMGLAASFVVLTIPDPKPNLGREADRFAARLVHAREEAVMTNRTIEVRLTADGYEFGSVSGGRRETLGDRPFGHEDWVEGTGIQVEGEGEGRVAFDPTGQSRPARIVLSRGDRTMTIDVDSAGNVAINAPR